jgi:hypothetical protein
MGLYAGWWLRLSLVPLIHEGQGMARVHGQEEKRWERCWGSCQGLLRSLLGFLGGDMIGKVLDSVIIGRSFQC